MNYKVIHFGRGILIKLFLISILAVIVFAQNKTTLSKSEATAEQILERARSLVNKNNKAKDIKSVSMEFTFSKTMTIDEGHIKESLGDIKLFISLPNQIRIEEFTDFTTNQQLYTEIFDSPKYSVTSDVLVNGKPFAFGSNLSSIAPKFTKEQQVNFLHQRIFGNIFPIFFQNSLYQKLKFNYIGEAQSKDFKAYILEASDKNNVKYNLFFDKQTHMLLVITERFINYLTNIETERRTYYKDYKEVNGLLVAHKITIQTGNIMTEVRELRKLEINPTFKPSLFEIKEDKINPY